MPKVFARVYKGNFKSLLWSRGVEVVVGEV